MSVALLLLVLTQLATVTLGAEPSRAATETRYPVLFSQHGAGESSGTSHEWQTWRRSLHDLAPRLFR